MYITSTSSTFSFENRIQHPKGAAQAPPTYTSPWSNPSTVPFCLFLLERRRETQCNLVQDLDTSFSSPLHHFDLSISWTSLSSTLYCRSTVPPFDCFWGRRKRLKKRPRLLLTRRWRTLLQPSLPSS
jgi:hypothetical protein